jgi:hypothetical protein
MSRSIEPEHEKRSHMVVEAKWGFTYPGLISGALEVLLSVAMSARLAVYHARMIPGHDYAQKTVVI